MMTRIIGIGHDAGGDDAAGLEVIRLLQGMHLPPEVDLVALQEPSRLLWLLEETPRAIIVDAVAGGGSVGAVWWLSPEVLASGDVVSLSSHGVGVTTALEMYQMLKAGDPPEVTIVGIAIDRPAGYACGVSPRVQEGVRRAAQEIYDLVVMEKLYA